MQGKRRVSEAMHYSIAELGFILFFLAVGAAALLYGRVLEEEARTADLETLNTLLNREVDRLIEEVDFLNEILAEKEHGVVPCWRRPDGEVPRIVGVLTIHHRYALTLEHHAYSPSPESSGGKYMRRLEFDFTQETAPLQQAVRELFASELAYAREKNCYLRLAVKNETNSFAFYQSVSSVLVGMGIVVVSR